MKTLGKILIFCFTVIGIYFSVQHCRGHKLVQPNVQITDTIIVNQNDTIPYVSALDSLNLPGNITMQQLEDLLFIANYALELNMKHPDIFLAQVIQETLWLTSDLYKNNNNAIGMQRVINRPTTQLQSNGTWGVYKTVKASVLDYYIWQVEYANNLNEQDYMNALKKYEPNNTEHYLYAVDSLRQYSKQIINYAITNK